MGKTIYTKTSAGESSLRIPCNGIYQLQVYGASGGGYKISNRGRGGYAKGNVSLNAEDIIYIYCGGKGSYRPGRVPGGANGGGGGYCYGDSGDGGGSGGGATHIGRKSGTLTNYSNYRSDLFIVAGGGGGEGGFTNYYSKGGDGGGSTGSSSQTTSYTSGTTTGGTQTKGGQGEGKGSFGQGGSATSNINNGGGGGGFYGGGAGVEQRGGGGGSGYVGGCISGTTSMTTGAGGNNVNGRCTITLLEADTMTLGTQPILKMYLGEEEILMGYINNVAFPRMEV